MSKGKVGSSAAVDAVGPRKGKSYCFVYTKERGLIPFGALRRFQLRKQNAEARTASAQTKSHQVYMSEKGLVPLPFAVEGLLTLAENCSFFDACVKQIAKDVTGQGYSLMLREGVKAENETRKLEVLDFFDDPNTEEEALEDVLERLIVDWGITGWFCLEVVRDGGEVTGLYHVPAHTVKVHKDGNKYCQIRNNKYVWFKRFGYNQDVNVDTGEEGSISDEKKRAHELIFYRNYYPQSSWYGAPNILPAVGAVKALISIRDYNLAFFENYGVPAAVVTVTGDWDEDSVKQISDFIDVEIKGSANAHKTIVLNPPEGGEVKWEPLVVEVKEGSFKLYHKTLRDEVLVAYKMPPYRIGIAEVGALGGSTAPEATRIYIDSIVNPLKRLVGRIFSQKIVRDGFECKEYMFKLGELDTRDMDAIARRCVALFGVGAMTRNEIRAEIDKDKIDEKLDGAGDKFYVATSYVEVGAEPVVDEATAQQAAFARLEQKVNEAIGENRAPLVQQLMRPRNDESEEA
jgi:PBSX family phage portal protein